MLKGFGTVLTKELRELVRDPKILLGMIIVPLIMFPVLGSIMSFSIQSAAEQAKKASALVLDRDGGIYATAFMENLKANGVKIYNLTNVNPEEAVNRGLLSEYNTTQIIEIPNGFSENITRHLAGETNVTTYVKLYSVFSGTGIVEDVGSSLIDLLVERLNRQYAPDLMKTSKASIIKGQIYENVDPRTLSGLMISQAIAMPITIMILLTYSMQIAATSVAMEKEEKTLETLLTLPMDRFAILMGKLSGSILVAGIGALAYMVGFNYHMGSFASFSAVSGLDLASVGLAPSLLGYVLLGISLFVTLLSALALAVILSAFAEDVRSAQSMVGYIYPFLFVPSLALMYVDINMLPLAARIALYAIPYTHPIIASKAVTMGDNLTAALGIVYVAIFTLVIMYVASRLFATEKILTMKLKFKGFRKREKSAVAE
ncbi:MAG: ABC transporter permease [Candidatus Bathyarchaeota archaeon]|nr:ABC transporter permease [Candidatus Bathyarchaeota archaeon]